MHRRHDVDQQPAVEGDDAMRRRILGEPITLDPPVAIQELHLHPAGRAVACQVHEIVEIVARAVEQVVGRHQDRPQGADPSV